MRTNFETKSFKFLVLVFRFLGSSDQNKLYHTPLLSKIGGLGDDPAIKRFGRRTHNSKTGTNYNVFFLCKMQENWVKNLREFVWCGPRQWHDERQPRCGCRRLAVAGQTCLRRLRRPQPPPHCCLETRANTTSAHLSAIGVSLKQQGPESCLGSF